MRKFSRVAGIVVGLVMLLERVWKHIMIIRFFHHTTGGMIFRRGGGGRGSGVGTLGSPVVEEAENVSMKEPLLVSIMQPILSGDPTLQTCLEHNLRMQSQYQREFVWLVDDNDAEGQRICKVLMERYPEQIIHLLLQPPTPMNVNPKLAKLIAGANVAQGDILCVLDDDTMLPDGGLEQCLPFLDVPGVGLAFGLPYYVNFTNFWSRLVAYFVNSNSLLTYIPYTMLTRPFTINGMFYAMKREVFTAIGGFTGIEHQLADDFAIAQRVRQHDYVLAQTPLRHAISTHVNGPRPYLNLIQRWFIFPRESLLRYLSLREQLTLYSVAIVPALFPLLLLLAVVVRPSKTKVAYILLYFGYNFALFVHLNRRYLRNASPLSTAWLVPMLQIVFPLQLLVALLSPQKINWRGHIMRVEKGGKFQVVQRRSR